MRLSVAKGPRPSLYTIPLNRAFADALIHGVVAMHGGSALHLARGMILLPNRRAIAAVRDAFIRHSGQAMVLPRLVSLGDGDLDEAAGAALDRIDGAEQSNAAIEPLHRQLLLAQMVARAKPDIPMREAMRLATSVAQVIDQLLIEEISLEQFCAFEPDEGMAGHWSQAFALLKGIFSVWPSLLSSLGLVDRTHERNRLLNQAARGWAAHGLPAPFVVAAGISTSAPAIARLLKTIANAPGGTVVLPHLDVGMSAEEWDALGEDPRKPTDMSKPRQNSEAHPQYHLKLLLDRMGFHRDEVAIWPGETKPHDHHKRVALTRTMMASAQFTDSWPRSPWAKRKLTGITFYDLATPDQEALTIALALREVLETPGKTAALVTSDRAIAARVAGHLARWGIVADDSAGTPLSNMAAGELLLSLIAAAASGWAPVELIALLSHPHMAAGDGRRIWLDHVRELDLLLRGPRPASGLDAIAQLITQRAVKNIALADWWAALSSELSDLDNCSYAGPLKLDAILATIIAALGHLAGDAMTTGAAGRALTLFMDDLVRHAPTLLTPLTLEDLEPMVRTMMRSVPVRPPHGGHPRLFIWGLIEARLQRADRMVLAGLNEGQWPARPAPDAWLAPIVRRSLGLPGNERQIGLSSHDFTCALGGDEVIITRSKRDGSSPTVASRLRLRLDALLGSDAVKAASAGPHARIAAALDACDQPNPVPISAFSPGAEKRPRRLSVTEVDTLRADPFAFYARNALGLRSLEKLDADPSAAWRGTAVHNVLEHWLKGGSWTRAALDQQLDALLNGAGINPIMRAIWAPRLRATLCNFVEMILADIGEGRVPIVGASEERGSLSIGGITLSGKADRIDRLVDGTLAIVDYKTGGSPTSKAVDEGYALQLGLLGAMAQAGAFPGAADHVSLFEYWRANRHTKTGQLGWREEPFYALKGKPDRKMDASNFATEARTILDRLIADYLTGDKGFVAKLVPQYAPYADYDQLMRLEEWYGRGRSDAEPLGEAE